MFMMEELDYPCLRLGWLFNGLVGKGLHMLLYLDFDGFVLDGFGFLE